MNKQEFIELAGIKWDDISEEDYELVEYVYARHPAINSKQDIANLYNMPNGMMIIRDMVETAGFYERVEYAYFSYQEKMNEAKRIMELVKIGKMEKAKEALSRLEEG